MSRFDEMVAAIEDVATSKRKPGIVNEKTIARNIRCISTLEGFTLHIDVARNAERKCESVHGSLSNIEGALRQALKRKESIIKELNASPKRTAPVAQPEQQNQWTPRLGNTSKSMATGSLISFLAQPYSSRLESKTIAPHLRVYRGSKNTYTIHARVDANGAPIYEIVRGGTAGNVDEMIDAAFAARDRVYSRRDALRQKLQTTPAPKPSTPAAQLTTPAAKPSTPAPTTPPDVYMRLAIIGLSSLGGFVIGWIIGGAL